MNKKLGQEPAFARAKSINPLNADTLLKGQRGMSKRFYAACAAMQGLCATPDKGTFTTVDDFYKSIVTYAYNIADELLRQEEL